jgi:ribosomal protein S12 methylthiotransferase accessory factor
MRGPLGITRVANVTGLDVVGIPTFMVVRPNARSVSVSQGKGVNEDAARASGLMEALELFHAERITNPLKLGSWNDLRGTHRLAAVEGLPCTSLRMFHPDRSVLWIEGVDLFSSEPTWLPFECVHTNYTLPLPTGSGCFVLSSNGLASGNHMLEAINHGLCEVIERDATTLFQCLDIEQQRAARLRLDTVSDPTACGLLDLYAKAGIAVGVWDVTSDIGIPTFRCVVIEREPSSFRTLGPIEGMGCHPCRETALIRALTEAAQARLTRIAGSRDDAGHARFEEAQDESLIRGAREELMRDGSRRFDQVTSSIHPTLEDDLRELLEGLSSAGLRSAVAVDLTKPELGVPVVRVVAPGLETYHHVEGYVPGRRAAVLLERRKGEAVGGAESREVGT